MATEVSANFQDPSGGPINAYYAAQNQRASMMQRARADEQQKLSNEQMRLMNAQLEQKRLEWDVQAPLRQKQDELAMLETGAKLYTVSANLDSEKSLASEWPALTQQISEAQTVNKLSDDEFDYEDSIKKWTSLAANLSKYQGSTRGKQAYDMAVMQTTNARLLNQSQIKERIVREENKNRLHEVIVNGKLMKQSASGDMAPATAATTIDEAGQKAGAEQEAKNMANETSEYLKTIDTNAAQAVDQKVTLDNVIGLLQSKKANTGFGQSQINLVRGAMRKMNIGDPEQLKNDQFVVSNLRMLRLELARTVMKGGGAISDAERNLLALATANEDYSPEANIAILSGMRKMLERDEQLGRLKMKMEMAGLNRKDIAAMIKQDKLDAPISGIEDIDEMTQDTKTANSKEEFEALAKAGYKSITFNGKTYKREQKQK